MYHALGWEPPAFAHLGLLHNEAGEKLSKRHGTIDIAAFRDQGVLPQALVNFVALLGWSHSENSDYMQISKLISRVSVWNEPSVDGMLTGCSVYYALYPG